MLIMELRVRPVPPFDFDLSAKIFSDGNAQIRKYKKAEYWQVIRLNSKLALMIITSTGTVDRPELSVKLKPEKGISEDDKKAAVEIVRSLFNLKVDLNTFYMDMRKDAIMATLVQKLRGLKSPTTPTVFEALIDSVVEQQISLQVAHSIEKRIVKTFGDTLKIDDCVYYAFPTYRSLASASISELRQCGLSLKKAEYIRGISRLVMEGSLMLDKFKDYPDSNQVIKELDDIRGVGVWTAELTMIRGMQRFDVIPADDLGVRRCVSRYYCGGRRISSEETRVIAEKWGRWKGLASYYLIVAERLGIEA